MTNKYESKVLTAERVAELLEEGRKAVEESRKPKLPGNIQYYSGLRAASTDLWCSVCKDGRIEHLYSQNEHTDYQWRSDGSRCDRCGLKFDFRGLEGFDGK